MMPEYVQIYAVDGHLAGEMIRLLLESVGIPAIVSQESAGTTYGLTVGPLGEARIYVPADRAEEALQVIKDMEEGRLETGEQDFELDDNKLPPEDLFKDV